MTQRCHLCRRGLPGVPGQRRRRTRPRARSGAETRSAPSTAGTAGTARGRTACRPAAEGPEPLARPCSAFSLLLTQLGLLSCWRGDAGLLLLSRAGDKELRFLFRRSLGDFFSLFAFLRLSIIFKNVAKVSAAGAPDTLLTRKSRGRLFPVGRKPPCQRGFLLCSKFKGTVLK